MLDDLGAYIVVCQLSCQQVGELVGAMASMDHDMDEYVSDSESQSPQPVRRRPAAAVRRRPAAAQASSNIDRVEDSSDVESNTDGDCMSDGTNDSTDDMAREIVSSNAEEAVAFSLGKLGQDVCGLIHRAFNGSVNLGTLCSGLDVIAIGTREIQKTWQKTTKLPPMLFKHVFACESVEEKRDLSNAEVVWRDVVEVGSGKAYDVRAKSNEPTIGCDILVAGFSCKDFSFLNNSPVDFKNKTGKSGSTYWGVQRYIKNHRPRIVVLEIVKAITSVRKLHGSGDRAPSCTILTELRAQGYACGFKIFNTHDFGLPQRRTRCYIIGIKQNDIHATDSAIPDPAAAMAFDHAAKLKCHAPPLDDFMSGALPPKKRRGNQRETWRAKHKKAMQKFDITDEEVDDMMASNEFQLQPKHGRTERMMHLTAVHYVRWKKQGMNPFTTPLVMQICQSCSRVPTARGECPCVTPRGEYWVSNAGVFLTAYDKLALQGVTHHMQEQLGLDKLKPNLVGDLAGNAFSMSVINAVVLGAMASWAERQGC